MKVLKYELNPLTQQLISMPLGSEILTVQVQHDALMMWVKVDDTACEYEDRHFALYGTGIDMDTEVGKYRYIDTVQFNNGRLIFHIFEVI